MKNTQTTADLARQTFGEPSLPQGSPGRQRVDPLMISEADESDELENTAISSQQSGQSQDLNKLREEGFQPFKMGGGGVSGLSQSQRDRVHPAVGRVAGALSTELAKDNEQVERTRESSILVSGNDRNRKLLTDYTLSMLNFIPATILQQLCSDENLEGQSRSDGSSPSKPYEASSPGLMTASSKQTTIHQANLQLPLCYRSKSIVLAAEIINFYDQTKAGDFSDCIGFNEYMARLSGQFLEVTASILNKYGGDLIQFLGYSLVAIWPPDPNEYQAKGPKNEQDHSGVEPEFRESSNTGYAQEIARKAAQCALEVKKEVEKLTDAKIKLVFGMGLDDIQVLHMGGVLKRVEFFVCGRALQKALGALRATRTVAEKQQGSEQSIAVSSEIWYLIKAFFNGQPDMANQHIQELSRRGAAGRLTENQAQQPLYWFISSTLANVRLTRNIYLRKQQIDATKIQKVQVQLKSYIPGAFRHLAHSKDGETTRAFGQHLKQTVLAMAIELNQETLECSTKEQLTLLQTIIEIIQTQVYRMEGAVTKVMTYEGGLIVAASWGSAFLSHYDDPPRAIFAALNIKRHLRRFQQEQNHDDDSFVEPPVHIGIATGDIYQGVIGSYTRREVVSIGEAFERAFLLMQTAVQHYGKVYLDFNTKQMSCQYIDFEFVEHLEFSHKITNEAIFEPTSEKKDQQDRNIVDPEYEGASMSANLLDSKAKARFQASRIRIHSNPFFVDRDNSYQRNFCEAYGRADIISQIVDDIADYVQSTDSDHVWVLAVRGSLGSGKSLFSRRLLLETNYRQKQILQPHIAKNPKFVFEYISCSANINQSQKFVGIWRPFLRHLLDVYSNCRKQSKEYTINSQVLFGNVDDKVQTIEEIFGLKHLARNKSQRTFNMQDNNSQAVLSSMKSKPSLAQSKSQTTVGPTKVASQTNALLLNEGERFDADYEDSIILFCLDFIVHALEELKPQCCFFVVLDNISTMNLSSWKLFDLVSSQSNFLVLVMNIQTKASFFAGVDQETDVSDFEFKIFPDEECLSYYRKNLKPREHDIFNIADMGPLQKQFFKDALLDLSKIYEKHINVEIEHMTKILDASNTVKTFAAQKDVQMRLISHYSAYQHYNDIEEQIMDEIMRISMGNPLTAFWFAYQAIIGDFVQIKEYKLITSSKFRHSVAMNNWTSLQLPYFLFKKNQVRIQKAVNRTAKGISQLENSAVVQMMQLLQTASVIGDVFSSKLLDHVNKHFIVTNKQYSTSSLLRELEDRDLIEMIYDDNTSSEKFYRFNHPFTRVTLYQMQPFEGQVRQIHLKVIQFMKDNTMLDYTTGWSLDKEYSMMKRHIMSAEQVHEEEKLPRESAQALMIKKVNQGLSRNSKNIVSGNLGFSVTDSKDKLLSNLKYAKDDQRLMSKSEEVFVVLKQRRLEWFQKVNNNEDYGEANYQGNLLSTTYRCLGFVDLDQISKVKEVGPKGQAEANTTKIKRVGQSKLIRAEVNELGDAGARSFKLKCNKWFRLSQRQRSCVQQDRTNLIFTHLNQQESQSPTDVKKGRQALEWITAIEYLRTKIIMDSFVNSYGLVNFSVAEANQSNQQSLLQQKQAVPVQERLSFSRAYAHNQAKSQQSQVLSKTPDTSHESTPKVSNDGNLLAQRQYTVKAMKKIKVNQLAGQLRTLFNISYLSFLGHMSRSSMADAESKKDINLGQLHGSVRQPISGGGTLAAVPIKDLFQKQVYQVLSPNSRMGKRYSTVGSSLMESDLSNVDGHQNDRDLDKQHTLVDGDQISFERGKSPHSGDDQSDLNESMNALATEDDMIKLMFGEERRCQLGKLKPGGFVHGFKLGEARMVPQEKFEGELGQFTLQRRIDKQGYNQVRSPFLVNSGTSSKVQSQEDSQTNILQAQAGYEHGSYQNDMSASSSNFQLMQAPAAPGTTLRRERSILSLQAQQKLPEQNRVAKGLAIQKILENTQKPWYMLTGREYHRPQLASSKLADLEKDDQEDGKSAAASERIKVPPTINIEEETKSMVSRGSQTPSDLGSVKSKKAREEKLKKFTTKEESKHSDGRSQTPRSNIGSEKSVSSKASQRKNMMDLRSQVIQQSRLSATKIPQKNDHESNMLNNTGEQSKDGSFSEYVNLISSVTQKKEFTGTFGSSETPQKKQQDLTDMQAAAAYLNQISNTGMLDSGAENYSSIAIPSEQRHAFKQTNETIVPSMIKDNFLGRQMGQSQGRKAVVQYDKTPFIVLSDGGRQQNPEDLGLALNRGDIVMIDKDILTKQTEYGLKLTKCLMETRQGVTLNIVLASHTIKPIDERQQQKAIHMEETKRERISSEQMQEAMFNFRREQPIITSSSQMLGMQIHAKAPNETSADNLLKMTPSQLDFYPAAIKTGLDMPSHRRERSQHQQHLVDQVADQAALKVHQRQLHQNSKLQHAGHDNSEQPHQLYSYKKRVPSGTGLALPETHTMFKKMEQRKRMKERQEQQIAEIEAIQREARTQQRVQSPSSELARTVLELDQARGRNLQTDQDRVVRKGRLNLDAQENHQAQQRAAMAQVAPNQLLDLLERRGPASVQQERTKTPTQEAREKAVTPTNNNDSSAVPVALKVNERVRKKREVYYQ